ncbi:hypothetical protein AB0M45_33695 [Nocardia sp. NPDC051787]|uniref:hypothetical protein n=1 Tax=Nocardia sp. NPDC051787 TaxID=3155415 RepID=UPI003446A594
MCRTAFHEVTLISLVAYTDGFSIQIRVRYPVGAGATPDPGPSQITLAKIHAIAVEASDDLGNEYRCRLRMAGAAGPGGDWQAYGDIECDPVIAPDANAIIARLSLPLGRTDRPEVLHGEIKLMPMLGEIPAAAAARLARVPIPDRPVERPDLRPVAAADLLRNAELHGVSAFTRSARRNGVTLRLISMEHYDRGSHLRLVVELDDDHPEAIAHRTADPATRDSLAWILNADCLHLTDDLGNRYPLAVTDVRGDRVRRTVSVTSALPVPDEPLALRLDAHEIVWCRLGSDGSMRGGERITADPGAVHADVPAVCRAPAFVVR